jgi:hypothetical protein
MFVTMIVLACTQIGEDIKNEQPVDKYGRAELVTKWPLVAYMLTALFCLGCSSVCHLTYVQS